MLVTLPCVLLLLDFWPLGRARIPRLEVGLVVEKLPLLALSAASSGVAYVAQKLGGSMQGIEALPLSARMGNAVVSYADYLWTMVWPVDLAVLYPFSQQLLGWRLAASALFLAGISSLVLRRAQERPYLPVGWLWYLGTLVPVIGLVQVGLQAKADRYTYVPLIGIFIMIAWSLPDPMRRRSPRASALAAGVLAVLVALAWRSHVQVGYWRDTVTLFDRTLAITRDNYMAHDVKGYALAVERGWLDEAIVEYREALRIHPRFPLAMNHLANALFEKRALAEAAEWYRKLLELAPHSLEGQQNLAVALSQMGRYAEAVPHYREALRLRPKLLEAQVGLGLALDLSGRMAEAIPVYEAVLEIDPNRAEVHMQLGKALAKQGRTDEGIAHLREALRLQPELADAKASLERLQREPER
jgi:tetratricopeptide (TPR) repeat protein